jgi:CheY-like chemotaxis protein
MVILDLVFNTGSEPQGWQLLQKLRMSPETEATPIVLCSAATDQVREQEGWLTAKGVKVVAKPFTVDDLELAITKALSLPRMLTSTLTAPRRLDVRERNHTATATRCNSGEIAR